MPGLSTSLNSRVCVASIGKTGKRMLMARSPIGTKTANFKIQDGKGGAVDLTLGVDQISELIRNLGNVRAKLTEGAKIPPAKRSELKPVMNAKWFVKPELIGEASLIAFYHPAYGYVSFMLPMGQVKGMIELLAAQVQASDESHTHPM